ncbi:fluoride efflux transporter CrcB [Rhizobium sp. 1399]|jgi:CrcB protein|uniref:fluoride efflux transporter CrcB n=1 Tax=Rhizobium sp. 1399 TaxID=2817758 RepID=UPI002861494E|nr:fluoride efflux transporter CrcB [Rhizobium sp. 1399]MDR6668914.1 CrcB protein [Rhizobium sp. 1399]
MSFYTCLIVMAGGALGTFARYAVSIIAMPISRDLPWGTVIINVTGSLIIGLFSTLTLANGRFPASDNMRLFVIIGLCGGYTTFSSFSLQTLDLLRSGAAVRACINVAASVVLCIGAVALGHLIATRINGGVPQVAQTAIEEQA